MVAEVAGESMSVGARDLRVAVFGLGYVGCVSAACFADRGHAVVGVDVNPEKVALLAAAKPTVIEERIGELIAEGVASRPAARDDRRGRGDRRDRHRARLRRHAVRGRTAALATEHLEHVADEIGAALRDARPTATPSCSAARCCPARATTCSCRCLEEASGLDAGATSASP